MMRHTKNEIKDKDGKPLGYGCVVWDSEFKENGTVSAEADGSIVVDFDSFDATYDSKRAARLEIIGWDDPHK